MSDNVANWLAEVRSLQQQIKALQQEREQAYSSADNWRKLYEGEAQQRRRDAAESRRKIEQLQQALAAFESNGSSDGARDSKLPTVEASASGASEVESSQTPATLQAQLLEIKKRYDQLKIQLQNEQQAHEQTRDSLTAALSDTVNLLTKERTEAQKPSASDR